MENTEKQSEWSEREIGALWKRESPNQKYLTGKLKVDGVEKNVVIFSNKNKQKETHPDFRVYLSRDRQAVGTSTEDAAADKPQDDLL